MPRRESLQTRSEDQREENKVLTLVRSSRGWANAAKSSPVNTSACVSITWPDTFICFDLFMRMRGPSLLEDITLVGFSLEASGMEKQWIIWMQMNGWRNVLVNEQRHEIKSDTVTKATLMGPWGSSAYHIKENKSGDKRRGNFTGCSNERPSWKTVYIVLMVVFRY